MNWLADELMVMVVLGVVLTDKVKWASAAFIGLLCVQAVIWGCAFLRLDGLALYQGAVGVAMAATTYLFIGMLANDVRAAYRLRRAARSCADDAKVPAPGLSAGPATAVAPC